MEKIAAGPGLRRAAPGVLGRALTAKSDSQKQAELIQQAQAYLEDEVYIRCVPLLEEAVGYSGKHTEQAETLLKQVYTQLFEQSGYRSKYTDLLERQMARKNRTGGVPGGRGILPERCRGEYRAGDPAGCIARTESQDLVDLYEANRYLFKLERSTYHDVTAIVNGTIQVKLDGKWGLADATGSLLIPCQYDKISTCWNGETIVMQNGLILPWIKTTTAWPSFMSRPAISATTPRTGSL